LTDIDFDGTRSRMDDAHVNGSDSPSPEHRRVDLGHAALEVTLGGEVGSGAPVLCAAHPADAFVEGTVALLQDAAGAPVVCVNPRGIGASSPPAADPGGELDAMVDDIEAARRLLGLGPWVFWGMSGGGWLGQIYAHRHPGSLIGLIVESVCPCFRRRLADPECLASPFHPAWRARLEELGLVDPSSHDEVGDLQATEWDRVEGVGEVFRRRGGPALLVWPGEIAPAMRRVMPALWAVDTRALLPTVRVPTLVLCGTADPIVPIAHARAVHEAIAGSELVVVEGAGHVPTAQQRPEVAAAVRRFLARVAPDQRSAAAAASLARATGGK
jgi:pimeloyl-ACP methyl ester carboxylesterase